MSAMGGKRTLPQLPLHPMNSSDLAGPAALTRRSALGALGFGIAVFGLHGLTVARTAIQARQCQPPQRLRGLPAPYVVRIAYAEGAELLFLAARHSNDRNSPTHALVRHMLGSMGAESVILEGYFDDPAKLSPEDLDLFQRGIHPENRYALALANERGIRAVGGDMRMGDVALASVSHGFEIEDVIGTHMVRMFSGQISTANPAAVEAWVRGSLGALFPTGPFNFEEWYISRVGEPPSDNSFRRIYRGPCGSGIIAEIASFESETRNQHLRTVIVEERHKFAKVGAVFGANHLFSIFESLVKGAVRLDIVTPAELPDASGVVTIS